VRIGVSAALVSICADHPARYSNAYMLRTIAIPTMIATTPVRCVKSFAAKFMLVNALRRAGNFPEEPMRKAIRTPTRPSPGSASA
jgi:hypothetical protein